MKQVNLEELDRYIDEAMREDVGDGDHTSQACIPKGKRDDARLIVKDDGIICGVSIAKYIFERIDPTAVFTELIADGEEVQYGDIAFTIEMNAQALLKTE